MLLYRGEILHLAFPALPIHAQHRYIVSQPWSAGMTRKVIRWPGMERWRLKNECRELRSFAVSGDFWYLVHFATDFWYRLVSGALPCRMTPCCCFCWCCRFSRIKTPTWQETSYDAFLHVPGPTAFCEWIWWIANELVSSQFLKP